MPDIEQLAFSLHECLEHQRPEAAVHVIIGGDPVWSGPLTRDALAEMVRDLGELVQAYDEAEARMRAARN